MSQKKFLIDFDTPVEIFQYNLGNSWFKTNYKSINDYLPEFSKNTDKHHHYFVKLNNKLYCMSALLLIPIETLMKLNEIISIESNIGVDINYLLPIYLFHYKLEEETVVNDRRVFKFRSKDNSIVFFKEVSKTDNYLVPGNCYVFEGHSNFTITNIFFNSTYQKEFNTEKPSWV